MVVKKFDQFEFPLLFSQKPNNLESPFRGTPFMPIDNPEFFNLKESDGYIDVKLVRKVTPIEHYVYCAGMGEGFECNEINNQEALKVIELMEFDLNNDAMITGYYPDITIAVNKPDLSIVKSGNLEIKFISHKGNLSEFIKLCMSFSSLLKELILKHK